MAEQPNAAWRDEKREFPNVREERIWRRLLLTPICWIVGHKPGLLRPIVPNPYATKSWVHGCGRCSSPYIGGSDADA